MAHQVFLCIVLVFVAVNGQTYPNKPAYKSPAYPSPSYPVYPKPSYPSYPKPSYPPAEYTKLTYPAYPQTYDVSSKF